MPAVPNTIISDVTELILNHTRQTSHDPEGAPNSAKSAARRVHFEHSSENCRTDEGELESMDRDIDALEETLTRLQTSLNTQLLQRKRQRNRLIRFNQLPLEIASDTLWLSIVDPWPQKPSYSFLQRQQTTSSVCSSWRTLVQDSPRFWSTIEFSYPPTAISDFLEKSQFSGLHIKSFNDSSEYDCSPRHLFMEGTYLSLIASHTHRIRSLRLSLRSSDGLLAVLGKPAPILEQLKLDSDYYSSEQPLDLFCGQAGRLRDVALGNIPVRWDSDVLVGLRSLEIKVGAQYLPTDKQMRRLLEANPGLEKMDIEAWGETDTEHFGDDAVQSTREEKPSQVVMSKLHDLWLSNLPLELVQAILVHVGIPSIESLMLKCLFRGRPASRLLGPRIKHLVSPLLQRSKGAQRAELTFGGSSVELAIYTPHHETPTIQMQLKETVLSTGFDWLAENFFHAEGLPSVGAAEVFHVSLNFQPGFDMRGGRFIPILDRLNAVKVKDLTIECWGEHGEELIKYLGEPKEDFQWPLPYLTSMNISGPAELADHLLIALQRRKQCIPAEEMSAAPQPVTLEVLDIGGLREVGENVEKALANCVASSGTFIRRPPNPYQWEGRTPNPYQWGGSRTPAWVSGSRTPNPYQGGGRTPPWDGSRTPTWGGGGTTPNYTQWEGDVFGVGDDEST